MKAKHTYSIREYGYLVCGEGHSASRNVVNIPQSAFTYLLAYLQGEEREENFAPFLRLTTFKRNTALKVQNYVGVLQTPCGTQIEVLPKLYEAGREASEERTRNQLLTMLRCLRKTPYKQAGDASVRDTSMPLLEVYISQFLALTNKLVKRGVRSDYIREQKNAKFLKGRLRVSQQIRSNFMHPERFAIECDEYLLDRPANRLIKTALTLVGRVSRSAKNQRLSRELGFVFEEVQHSSDVRTDFQKVKTERGMNYYQPVLDWCRLLLSAQGPTASTGNFTTLSLLYPMERIFEDYVAHCLKVKLSDYFDLGSTLKTQAAKHSLVEQHDGNPIFKLKPDLLVVNGNRTVCVMDTKWKLLDSSNRKHKYGISQTDMYQLYAYGHKYLKSEDEKRLMLIYPKTDRFKVPLPAFHYENGFILDVVPFDLERGGIGS